MGKEKKPIMESEEGINDVLRILRFMGLNKVSLLTNLDENCIQRKLMTFECKLADQFFLKRAVWQLNKEEMPMVYNLIISIVEDAFYRCKNGQLIKTLRSTFQRQEYEDTSRLKKGLFNVDKLSPYK